MKMKKLEFKLLCNVKSRVDNGGGFPPEKQFLKDYDFLIPGTNKEWIRVSQSGKKVTIKIREHHYISEIWTKEKTEFELPEKFEYSFDLPENWKVFEVSMYNGIFTISTFKDKPEQEKTTYFECTK